MSASAQQTQELVEKANEQAVSFYNRAKTVFPHEGRIFHLLGQLAIKDTDQLAGIYNCMRALSCSYPSTTAETRESLINFLQEIRMKDIEESKLELMHNNISINNKDHSEQQNHGKK